MSIDTTTRKKVFLCWWSKHSLHLLYRKLSRPHAWECNIHNVLCWLHLRGIKPVSVPWQGTILPVDYPCIAYNCAKICYWALFTSLLPNIYITCLFSMDIHVFQGTTNKSFDYTNTCLKKFCTKINYTTTTIKVFLYRWSKHSLIRL